ncbi:MAG TPA: serine/threonine-protein kinase [Thermoanaerobaculia bacterium]
MGAIGAGGMGEVYAARDTRLDRDVAIKVLAAHLSSNANLRERFDREARAISKLNHPHVCTLFDVGHQDGIDYIVMEYLEGETLADALMRGPLPLRQVLRYGREIADALDTAHRLGIVHRDLKPGNIMLTKSGAKVLDFGLAKYDAPSVSGATDEATQRLPLTEEGSLLGTMQYMAPEQLEGRDADARTDIFALGAIVYEMAAGRRAFDGKSRASLIAAIMERDPVPISTIQPMAPMALDSVVRRCLAKEPDERLQSARDLAFSLEEIEEQSRSGETPRPARRASGKWLWPFAVLVMFALAGLIAVVLMTKRTSSGDQVKTIAVLPFANLGVDHSRDYLRLAIPDEVTTILSYSRDLAVRPFSVSRRLSGDIDPRDAAKKLNADAIVSGHIIDQAGHLSVTLEAIDATADKLLWRDAFDVPSADLINMRNELGARIGSGLLPRLHIAASAADQERSRPQNAEGYALYLRAAAATSDPVPNKEAWDLLERAALLDPNYAPIWAQIARRAYYNYSYADGGDAVAARAQEAARRALELDPDLVEAATRLIVMKTESGDLVQAYRDAKALVKRRPDDSDSHLALSYVLRYGGVLNEAARECNAAWTIDSRNANLRSCASVFMLTNDYTRAAEFARLDPGSSWMVRTLHLIEFLQGKAPPPDSSNPSDQLLARCAAHVPAAELAPLRNTVTAEFQRQGRRDGEPLYFGAELISHCGWQDDALRILNQSLRQSYCGFPAIDNDPLLAGVRSAPGFAAYHQAAEACHARFLAGR